VLTAHSMASPIYDADIRPALINFLTGQIDPNDDAIVLQELGISRGQVRADIAVVNGHIHAYEIKSERDSVRRLGAQAIMYSKCFDRATVVVSVTHLRAVQEIVPYWWGVLIAQFVDGEISFSPHRPPADNPSPDFRVMAELIWRNDALALLQKYGMSRGVCSKPRGAILDRICDQLPTSVIRAAVRANLKARKDRLDQLSRSPDDELFPDASTLRETLA
jgi:hypothetical protein